MKLELALEKNNELETERENLQHVNYDLINNYDELKKNHDTL